MEKIKRFFSKYKLSGTRILLICFFTFLVLVPLLRMLVNLDGKSMGAVFSHESFLRTVGNSLLSALLATCITLALGYALAHCIERTNIRGKGFWRTVLVLPMLIPAISHGMGLVVMFGNNGLFTRWFHLSDTIYGLRGIVLGGVMYAFPVAFLMFSDVLKYQDCTSYQAAKVLGVPAWRQFTSITLPYLRKPLISVALACFTMIITDYGVPLMVGGKYKTLSVTLYEDVIGQVDFAKGSVYGLLLLLPAVIGFLFDLLNKDGGNSSYTTDNALRLPSKKRDALAYVACSVVSLFALLPIFTFCLLAFAKSYPSNLSVTWTNLQRAVDWQAGEYLLNSVVIALVVALVGVALAFVTGYLTARIKSKSSKLLHLFAITSAAIPGVVLGLSYVLVFKGSVLYGTITILIMVNTVHFFSSPYLMAYNSLSKLNEHLEEVGQTLGVSRLRIIWNVILPQSLYTVLEMFAYFFVNSMMTISAVSFLAKTSNKPVALMINQFEELMQLEAAAVVSLAILLVNLLLKGGVLAVKKIVSKERNTLVKGEGE